MPAAVSLSVRTVCAHGLYIYRDADSFVSKFLVFLLDRPGSSHFLLHRAQRFSAAAASHQGAPGVVGVQHF